MDGVYLYELICQENNGKEDELTCVHPTSTLLNHHICMKIEFAHVQFPFGSCV